MSQADEESQKTTCEFCFQKGHTEQTCPYNFIYVSHLSICKRCKRPYGEHPKDPEHPFLAVRCDGRRLKL